MNGLLTYLSIMHEEFTRFSNLTAIAFTRNFTHNRIDAFLSTFLLHIWESVDQRATSLSVVSRLAASYSPEGCVYTVSCICGVCTQNEMVVCTRFLVGREVSVPSVCLHRVILSIAQRVRLCETAVGSIGGCVHGDSLPASAQAVEPYVASCVFIEGAVNDS